MKKFIVFFLLLSSQLSIGQNEYVLAENYYRDGAYKKAIQLYTILYNREPANSNYLKRLITCYQETAAFDKAESLLKNELNKHPNQTFLNIEIGYNFERQKQQDMAKSFYDKALSSIQTNPAYGLYIARVFKENTLLDYAVLAYKKTMEVQPNSNYTFQIAQIYGEQGKIEKMFQSYIDLLDTNKNYLNSIERFVGVYLSDDSENPNNILLKKLVLKKTVSQPKNSWNELLSWLFIKQKDYNKALIQEKALFKRDPSYLPAILNLGAIAFDDKDYNTASACIDFVLENSSFLAYRLKANEFKVKIAIATKQTTVESLFNDLFTHFGKNAATLPIQLLYADYLTFQKKDLERAATTLTQALSFASSKYSKASIQLKLGDLYVFSEKYNKALIEFSRVETQIKNHPLAQQARFKVAQTSYFKGDFKWAMAQLKVLKSASSQLIANDALELFLVISNNQPSDSVPTGLKQYARADLLGYQQKYHLAIDRLQQVITTFKGQPIEDDSLYKQALFFEETEQFQKAISNYIAILTMDKNGIFSDDATYHLAKIFQKQLNNKEKALEYYQKIIFDYPSSIYLVDARKNFRMLRGDTLE